MVEEKLKLRSSNLTTKQIINFNVKKFIFILVIVSIILIFISLLGQSYRYFFNEGKERYLTKMFNLDQENNFPTFFSTFLLLFSSVLFFIIGRVKQSENDKFTLNWFFLAIFFIIMSTDEILVLHEQLSDPIKRVINVEGYFHFAWLLAGFVLLLLLSLYNLKFFLSFNIYFRKFFFSAAAIYVTGAFLLEMIGGKFLSNYGQNIFGYSLITTVEESLEFTGLILLNYSLLKYIQYNCNSVVLKLE